MMALLGMAVQLGLSRFKDDVDSDDVKTLLDFINRTPGLTRNQLERELNFTSIQLSRCLHQLLKDESVVKVRDIYYTHDYILSGHTMKYSKIHYGRDEKLYTTKSTIPMNNTDRDSYCGAIAYLMFQLDRYGLVATSVELAHYILPERRRSLGSILNSLAERGITESSKADGCRYRQHRWTGRFAYPFMYASDQDEKVVNRQFNASIQSIVMFLARQQKKNIQWTPMSFEGYKLVVDLTDDTVRTTSVPSRQIGYEAVRVEEPIVDDDDDDDGDETFEAVMEDIISDKTALIVDIDEPDEPTFLQYIRDRKLKLKEELAELERLELSLQA